MINLKTKNWKIENIETILFDKDGTFIDLHYFWGKMTQLRASEIISYFNLDSSVNDEICLVLGFDNKLGKMLPDGITALYSRSKIIEIFKSELTKFGVKTTNAELEKIFDKVSDIFYRDMHKYTKPIVDAIEFIQLAYKKGLKLGIVTSDSVHSTRLTLKYFGWEHLFGSVVGRECSGFTKESGALSKIALSELGANPKTTVMIGDAPMDCDSAKNSGIEKTILVSTGQVSIKELYKVSEYTLKSLKDLSFE